VLVRCFFISSSIDRIQAGHLSRFPFALPARSACPLPLPEARETLYSLAYLHDRCPEVHSLGSDGAVPELSELADLLSRGLDVVGVLGGALVEAALRKAHVGVDLVGGHLGAERPDTEAGGHCEWEMCGVVRSGVCCVGRQVSCRWFGPGE